MENLLCELAQIGEWMEDETSKKVWESVLGQRILGGTYSTSILQSIYSTSRILELENYGLNREYVIAGAGNYGRITADTLRHAGYTVKAFVDNNPRKQGTMYCGVPVVSCFELCTNYKDTVVILDNQRIKNVFFKELVCLGFPQTNICQTTYDIIRAYYGEIYLDIPVLDKNMDGIFIDAGCFDGENALAFAKWSNDKYSRILSIEPMAEICSLAKKNTQGIRDIEIVQCALSDRDGIAYFSQSLEGLAGSKIGDSGDSVNEVSLRTIDGLVKDEKVSFIKMDIEGAELSALKGAINVIQRDKPALAISLYHNENDIIEIPKWIKNIQPEYKMYLRHYGNKKWDLVLYCI